MTRGLLEAHYGTPLYHTGRGGRKWWSRVPGLGFGFGFGFDFDFGESPALTCTQTFWTLPRPSLF